VILAQFGQAQPLRRFSDDGGGEPAEPARRDMPVHCRVEQFARVACVRRGWAERKQRSMEVRSEEGADPTSTTAPVEPPKPPGAPDSGPDADAAVTELATQLDNLTPGCTATSQFGPVIPDELDYLVTTRFEPTQYPFRVTPAPSSFPKISRCRARRCYPAARFDLISACQSGQSRIAG